MRNSPWNQLGLKTAHPISPLSPRSFNKVCTFPIAGPSSSIAVELWSTKRLTPNLVRARSTNAAAVGPGSSTATPKISALSLYIHFWII